MSRFVVGGFVLRSKLILIAALIFAPAMAEATQAIWTRLRDRWRGRDHQRHALVRAPASRFNRRKILVATASGTRAPSSASSPTGPRTRAGGPARSEPDLGVTSSACTGLAVQLDGRIVAVAHLFDTPSAGLVSYAVVRFLADGTLDQARAGTGVATVTIGTGAPSVLGPDDKVPTWRKATAAS